MRTFFGSPAFTGHRDFWRGLIGLVLAVAFFAGVVAVQQAGFGDRRVSVAFVQAAGLRVDDDVRIAGVSVGRVESMALAGDHVDVVLAVDSEARLGSDTEAEIKLSTILGSRYVALTPAGDTDLASSGIALSHSRVPFDLQDSIEAGTPVIEQVDGPALRASLVTVTDQLEGTPELTGQALDSISALSKVIGERKEQVAMLLENANEVTSLLSANGTKLTSLIGQGAMLSASITEQRGAVNDLLVHTDALTAQLELIFAENREKIDPLIGKLTQLSRGLANNDDTLRRVYESLPVAVRQLTNASGNGPYVDIATPWSLLPDNWLCTTQVVRGCR